MTPHEIIYDALERRLGIHEAERLAAEILERLAAQVFVVVQADSVIQQDGKVTVTRELLESVLADAETWVVGHYFTDGEIHPAMRGKYNRDMEDIWALKAELRPMTGEKDDE